DEAEVVVESLDRPGRPVVKGAGLAAFPLRRVVVLAVPGGVVAVLPQDLADSDGIARYDAVVAWVAGRLVDDDTGRHRMMVAAGEQCGPRRRAKRRRVHSRISQAVGGYPIESRRRDHATKGGRRREADVVGHDQKDVRSPLRGNDTCGP